VTGRGNRTTPYSPSWTVLPLRQHSIGFFFFSGRKICGSTIPCVHSNELYLRVKKLRTGLSIIHALRNTCTVPTKPGVNSMQPKRIRDLKQPEIRLHFKKCSQHQNTDGAVGPVLGTLSLSLASSRHKGYKQKAAGAKMITIRWVVSSHRWAYLQLASLSAAISQPTGTT
jgi:hypothetical protein